MKRYLPAILGLLISVSAIGQSDTSGQSAPTRLPVFTDSLMAKRYALTSAIYKDAEQLSNSAVRELYQSNPKALTAHHWGLILKPIGPVVAVSGLAFVYLGLQGHQEVGFVRGISTKANPYPDDVPVTYTKRSLPKLLAGIGLVVGAIYLIEWSNELTATSVGLYNAKPASIRNLVYVKSLKVGLTTTGNIGLEAQF